MIEIVPVLPGKAVTVAEAAAMAGRSTSWVRHYRNLGSLEGVKIDGRHGVTLDSLAVFLRNCREVNAGIEERRRMRAKMSSRRKHLALAIDNTK